MNILAIGGSDPSSGAGIQSNIKASVALGANCFSVITAVTSQNSQAFFDVEPVSPRTVKRQIDSVFADFKIDAITIGMVYSAKIISGIHVMLKNKKIPTIVDPVIKSTTGGVLLEESAVISFIEKIVPLADVITPNVKEAEVLSRFRIRKSTDLIKAARKIRSHGAKSVIITGCEFEKSTISDFVYDGKRSHFISGKKIPGKNHGSGCNFALALSYHIAQGISVADAAKLAKEFTYNAIKHSQRPGRGLKITFPKQDVVKEELAAAIQKFTELDGITSIIPEVQTNFVFAKRNSKSLGNIAGVTGRIVKAGKDAIVAGSIEYGGSRHIGTAVLTMQKKFPQIRSAVNIRFDERSVKRLQNAKYKVLSYDRTREPLRTKLKENSTVSWGIHYAIQSQNMAPDAVYHRGDVGKEPMIIIFGKNPSDVIAKVTKVL